MEILFNLENKEKIDSLILGKGITKTASFFNLKAKEFKEKYEKLFKEKISKTNIRTNLFMKNFTKPIIDNMILENKSKRTSSLLKLPLHEFEKIYEKIFKEKIDFYKILANKIKSFFPNKKILYKSDLDGLKKKFQISIYTIKKSVERDSLLEIATEFQEKIKKKEKVKFEEKYKNKKIEDILNKNNYKKIPGTENYWINENAKIIKKTKNNFKYISHQYRKNNKNSERYCASINSKSVPIHILLAKTFIKNLKNYKYVRAKDNNFLNLKIDNFEWVQYPAKTRVLKSIFKDEDTWLNFVLKNFIEGKPLNILVEILEIKAYRSSFIESKTNNNINSTLYTILYKYSEKHFEPDFRFFIIDKYLNGVFLNMANKLLIKKMKEIENEKK